jgi:hypothetical protein
MFFAGNAPKRGFSTRKCKESARMASLRTSPAANRALVSEAPRATAAGESRPTMRRIELRAAVLPFLILGLAVVGALPAAVQAKALASATINVLSLSMWEDRGTLRLRNDPQDRRITVGSIFSDFGNFNGPETGIIRDGQPPIGGVLGNSSVANSSFSLGPYCVDVTPDGCKEPALGGFDPMEEPYPTAGFRNGNLARNGQYVADAVAGATGDLAAGVRADVSLPGGEDDIGRMRTTLAHSGTLLIGSGINPLQNVYFRIEYEASRLAQSTGLGDTASASATLDISVVGQSAWNVFNTPAGDVSITAEGHLEAYSWATYYALNGLGNRTIDLNMMVEASARTFAPAAVPVAPTLLFIIPGLLVLLRLRSRPGKQ